MLELILEATRFSSPSVAGNYTDVPLKVTSGVALDDVIEYWMEVTEASASAELGLQIQTPPDGENWMANKTQSVVR